jgi:exodeoxyribonuclease VII small subunit
MTRAKAAKAEPPAPTDAPAFDFEQAMTDLEAVVERLEQGDVPLEEALASFEKGVALTRACQQALAVAEQKVELLLQGPGGAATTVAFEDDGDAGET